LLDHLIRSHTKALAPDMVAVMVDTPGALLRRFRTTAVGSIAARPSAIAEVPVLFLSFFDGVSSV
jgi:hypothetical protein